MQAIEKSPNRRVVNHQAMVFKVSQIPVIFCHESFEADVLDACFQSGRIGLTHMCLESGKSILICMTTKVAIYVLDTRHEGHVDLLRKLLEGDFGRLKFYTTRGQVIYHRLYTGFDIQPHPHILIDLPAFEVFMSMRKCCLNGSLNGRYTMTTLTANHDMIKYHNRIDLTKIYLGIKLPERNQQKEKEETKLIIENPESKEAKSVIRQRACLVDDLAIKMEAAFQSMIFQDGNNLYAFAQKVKGDKYIEWENLGDDSYSTVIEYLKKAEEEQS